MKAPFQFSREYRCLFGAPHAGHKRLRAASAQWNKWIEESVMEAFAQFERGLIRERQREGVTFSDKWWVFFSAIGGRQMSGIAKLPHELEREGPASRLNERLDLFSVCELCQPFSMQSRPIFWLGHFE